MKELSHLDGVPAKSSACEQGADVSKQCVSDMQQTLTTTPSQRLSDAQAWLGAAAGDEDNCNLSADESEPPVFGTKSKVTCVAAGEIRTQGYAGEGIVEREAMVDSRQVNHVGETVNHRTAESSASCTDGINHDVLRLGTFFSTLFRRWW